MTATIFSMPVNLQVVREAEFLTRQALAAEAEEPRLNHLKRESNDAWRVAYSSARLSDDGLMDRSLVQAAYRKERQLLAHIAARQASR